MSQEMYLLRFDGGAGFGWRKFRLRTIEWDPCLR